VPSHFSREREWGKRGEGKKGKTFCQNKMCGGGEDVTVRWIKSKGGKVACGTGTTNILHGGGKPESNILPRTLTSRKKKKSFMASM